MTQPTPDAREELSPAKRALLEIRELRSRLARYEAAEHEPLAIVGIGCRVPGGVANADSLWRALRDGTDAIRTVPPERWDAEAIYDPDPDRPGTSCTRLGGFLDGVDLFDAAFFGISPREAALMDPQQRMFLEVAWEALEVAGVAPDRLGGSATGVFVGAGGGDYLRALFGAQERIDAYAGSGGSLAMISGRLSYLLGLQGPSLTIDTACSSSLVAVHLACQSLRRGECDLALAGGVNLILGPEAFIAFTKARMLAPDGRCKTFDATANGFSRAEGCGVIVLRRLSDAVRRGDRVLAVIRGSAVNQDGRSGGLTAPNGPAQEAVIRAAVDAAGLQPSDVDYVEAHGTGTSLGDPIELQALGAALADGRSADRPLLVGSCKTNFGHLEAAAGITGLLKVVVALQHRRVPPSLHLSRPNPLVDWAVLPLRVPTTLETWPMHGAPARAGVSSFGFSGTNAHVVLEEAPPVRDLSAPGRPRHLLALSARDDAALRELAQRYLDRLVVAPPPVADLCHTANAGRAHLARRLAITGTDVDEIRRGLVAFVNGDVAPNLVTTPPGEAAPPMVGWLFTGQGAQHAGMGRVLYATSPTFRSVLDECAATLDPLLPAPLRSVLYAESDQGSLLDQTGFAQPALFALEYALSVLWRRWGIEPAVVLGHSLGEVVAACVAGVLPLTDALRLVADRGRRMQEQPAGGAMASVFASHDEVARALAASGGEAEIAAVNGPQHVVISGAASAVDELCRSMEGSSVETRRLTVSHAFHSRAMDGMLAPFERDLAGLRFDTPHVTLVSNVTGHVAEPGEVTRPAYWRDQVRRPVRFEASVRTAMELGVTHFLELGPAPVLLGMAARFAPAPGLAWLPSLRETEDDWAVMLASLSALYVAGVNVDWEAFDRDYECRHVDLPTYPFQRRHYWLDRDFATVSALQTGEHVWRSVVTTLDHLAGQGPVGVDLVGYADRWHCLDRLTDAHVVHVLRLAGLFTAPGHRATAAEVLARLGASAIHERLIERRLRHLAETGQLRREGDAFVSDRALPDPQLDARWAEAEVALVDDQPLLAMLRRCGGLLAEMLAQRVSPLEALFPGGDLDLAEGVYARSGAMRYVNGLVAGAAGMLAAARGPGARLRVLEVGAGTGATAEAVLHAMPAERTEYWFTDVSAGFLERARARFASAPNLRLATLDLDRDPASQGFQSGTFDFIVAANVVHATRDLRRSIAHLRDLVAPDGLLVLAEPTTNLGWFDLTFGLTEGWQHFEDDIRTDHPLLDAPRWLQILLEGGFVDARAWPPADSPAIHVGQHVIVARGPAGTAPAWAGQVDGDVMRSTPVVDTAAPARAAAAAFRTRLAETLPGDRLELVRDFVRTRVVQVLRLDAAEPPGRKARLMDLGFDSLMAIQLRNELGAGLGLGEPLPATLLFDHPTIDAIAQYLLARLAPSVEPVSDGSAPDAAGGRVAEIAAMSDAEIETMLLDRLGGA